MMKQKNLSPMLFFVFFFFFIHIKDQRNGDNQIWKQIHSNYLDLSARTFQKNIYFVPVLGQLMH